MSRPAGSLKGNRHINEKCRAAGTWTSAELTRFAERHFSAELTWTRTEIGLREVDYEF